MTLEPYLFFNGRCEEAIAFYQEAIGAEVTSQMRMNEAPDPPPPGAVPQGFENKIMHANLRIGAMNLMVSEGNNVGPPQQRRLALGQCSESLAPGSESLIRHSKVRQIFSKHFLPRVCVPHIPAAF